MKTDYTTTLGGPRFQGAARAAFPLLTGGGRRLFAGDLVPHGTLWRLASMIRLQLRLFSPLFTTCTASFLLQPFISREFSDLDLKTLLAWGSHLRSSVAEGGGLS
ncbi:MAG: hypothetical protein OJF47_003426 [Nitrospira sp.]|jgi:hypothetical protein|nr:MAG: hypothetical protein OJF47_003426 [Nitrospira sp.]